MGQAGFRIVVLYRFAKGFVIVLYAGFHISQHPQASAFIVAGQSTPTSSVGISHAESRHSRSAGRESTMRTLPTLKS
jgi:hypothetical protein